MKKTIITIAIIILIALLGLIVYQCFNNDNEKVDVIDENVEINNESYEGMNFTIDKINYLSDSDKIDSTKPFVYFIAPLYDDAEFEGQKVKQFRNEFVMYNNEDYVKAFPYINIEADGIDKINYMLKAYSLVNSAAILDCDGSDVLYSFEANVFDDILSLYIEQRSTPFNFIGINIDLKNKKVLSLEDILSKKNLTDDNILEELKKEREEKESEGTENYFVEKTAEETLKRILKSANNDYLIYNKKIDMKKDLNYYAEMFSIKELGYTNESGYTIHDWEFSKEYMDEITRTRGKDWTYKYSFIKDMVINDRLCYFIDKENNLNIYYREYLIEETNVSYVSKLIIN